MRFQIKLNEMFDKTMTSKIIPVDDNSFNKDKEQFTNHEMKPTKTIITPFEINSSNYIVNYLKFTYFPFLSGDFSYISFFWLSLFFLSTLGHDILMMLQIIPAFDFCGLICFSQMNAVTLIVADIVVFILIIIVFFFRIDYSKYEENWKPIGLLLTHELITKEMKSTKRDTLFFASIYLLFYATTGPYCIYVNLLKPRPLGLFQLVIETSHLIAYGLAVVLVFIKVHTIFTASSLIRVTFRTIGHSIETHSEVNWSIESLQHYRRMYAQTIELTNSANDIWSGYLSFSYPTFNIMGLLLLYTMISNSYDTWRYFVLGSNSLFLFWTLSFLNKYIIGINTEATALYETLHRKSLLDLGEKYMLETLLFLERIGRADIGYKLHGNFVFSPTLMASMVTLGVTIVIAFPSFVTIKF